MSGPRFLSPAGERQPMWFLSRAEAPDSPWSPEASSPSPVSLLSLIKDTGARPTQRPADYCRAGRLRQRTGSHKAMTHQALSRHLAHSRPFSSCKSRVSDGALALPRWQPRPLLPARAPVCPCSSPTCGTSFPPGVCRLASGQRPTGDSCDGGKGCRPAWRLRDEGVSGLPFPEVGPGWAWP